MGVCVDPRHLVYADALYRQPPAWRVQVDIGTAEGFSLGGPRPAPVLFEDTGGATDRWFEGNWVTPLKWGPGYPTSQYVVDVRVLLPGWWKVGCSYEWTNVAAGVLPYDYCRIMVQQNGEAVALDTVTYDASIPSAHTAAAIVFADEGDMFRMAIDSNNNRDAVRLPCSPAFWGVMIAGTSLR